MPGKTEAPAPEAETEDRLDKFAEELRELSAKVSKLLAGTGKAEPEGRQEPGQQPAAQTQAQRASGLASEMQQAIEDHERQKAHDAALRDLTDKVEKHHKALERPPREFRKIEHRMGWLDKDPG